MHEFRVHGRCAFRSTLQSSAAGDGARGKGFVFQGTERVYERARPFAIKHIALELKLDHEAARLEGEAALRFERVSPEATTMRLDAVGFDIERVALRPSA
ncbi:MAG: aminopeptidase, partial [Myxococcota bacterium]